MSGEISKIQIQTNFKGSSPLLSPAGSKISIPDDYLFSVLPLSELNNTKDAPFVNIKPTNKNLSTEKLTPEDLKSVTEKIDDSYNKLKLELEKEKKKQGWVGKICDWGKNELGASPEGKSNMNPIKWWGKIFINSDNGSKSAENDMVALGKEIEELKEYAKEGNKEEFLKKYQDITKNKEINSKPVSKDEKPEQNNLLSLSKYTQKAINYNSAQKASVDSLSDYLAWFAADGAYAAAAAGLVAAPFTGGASLLVTAGALSASVAAGAGVKTLIRYTDAKTGNNKYDSLKYDLVTGGFIGAISPLASVAASKITGSIARGLGGKVVEENLGTILTKDIEISGVNKATKFGLEYVQSSADWGVFDGSSRAFNNTYKTGSLKGSGKAFVEGFVEAALMGPVFDKSVVGLENTAKIGKSGIVRFGKLAR